MFPIGALVMDHTKEEGSGDHLEAMQVDGCKKL
jgi:hypothetical protein